MLLKQASYLLSSPAFWLGSCLLIAGVAANLSAGDAQRSVGADAAAPQEEKVMREGTRIEARPAECRSAGERLAILFADEGRTVIALENLSAQRILKAILDDPSDKKWTVTGTVTEYQGRNFLLLERVTRVSRIVNP